MQDLNPRPSVYKTAALPTELIRHIDFARFYMLAVEAFCNFCKRPRLLLFLSRSDLPAATASEAPKPRVSTFGLALRATA
jgi:hypothetical protein